MKKFLGTRLGIIVVTSLIAVLGISVVAQAALNLSKPLGATANIKSPTANLSFATIQNGSPISSIGFGDVEQGTTASLTVWVKNTGAYALHALSATVTGIDPLAGSVTVGTFGATDLAPGASTSVAFTLVPVDNGPTGPVTPTITFNATN